MKRYIIGSFSALTVALCASVAPAITHTWSGGNAFGPNSMANSLNWSGGTPVSSSSNLTLVFPASPSSLTPNQNIASPLELQSLQLASAYTFSGNAFRFNNLGAAPTLSSTGVFSTIHNDIHFAAPTAVSVGGVQMDFNGALSGGPVTFSAASGTPFVNIGGGAANSIQAIVNNDVQLYLNKASSVVSSLDINGGAVRVNAAGGIDAGTNITVNPTTLNVSYAPLEFFFAPSTFNNLTLNGANAAIVATTVTAAGAISANGTSAILGASSSNQPILDLNGNATPITVTGASDVLTITPQIINGTFTKLGAGTLTLFGFNSAFTGQNVVSAGTLRGFGASIGNNVLNNTLVELIGGQYSGNISGPGAVTIFNFNEYQSLNSYAGGTTIDASGDLDAQAQYLHGNITGAGAGAQIHLRAPTNQTLNATLAGTMDVNKTNPGVVSLVNPSTMTGAFNLAEGGVRFTVSNAIGTADLQVGPIGVKSLEAVGNIVLPNHAILGGDLQVVGGGNLSITSTTAKNTNFDLIHNSSGATTIDGKFTLGVAGSITVNSGQLTLGDPTVVGGFIGQGQIDVNVGGTLTLRSLNFISLPDVTLASGTLDVPNGYAIPLGAALQGTGNVTGRVATANGSTIIATGAMGLGDPSHPAGVNLDGELYTNQFIVSLSDSNQAVLGSLTDIGTATQNGMLSAGNGFVLNFGRNIVGRGQIQSNNLLADAAIINGDVNGDSFTNYLEFTGYVKGVGTFNNVAFSGTFSPGLSPTLMTVGNTLLLPSNVLDIEIGGLNRGSQYDAFDITNGSFMQLDGELQVTLFNAFSPALGDQFLLFQGLGSGAFGGTFDTFDFPALNPGLAWDASLLYSNGLLRVVAAVPEPLSMVPVMLLALGFGRRRRVSV